MSDARFEDAETGPLRLIAQDAEGLGVFSALVQDAVFPIMEMTYARARRPYERVQSLLVFEDVLAVRTTGIDRSDGETVLSLLQITYAPGPDGTGTVTLVLAGDGAIALELEALDATLRDVTKPYIAPSRKRPSHD